MTYYKFHGLRTQTDFSSCIISTFLGNSCCKSSERVKLNLSKLKQTCSLGCPFQIDITVISGLFLQFTTGQQFYNYQITIHSQVQLLTLMSVLAITQRTVSLCEGLSEALPHCCYQLAFLNMLNVHFD